MSTAVADNTVSRGTASGGIWDYISASRLNLWLKCPLAFRLRYIDGIKMVTTPNLFLGQRVHAGLEIHYRHRMLGVQLDASDVVAQMDAEWEEAVAQQSMRFDNAEQEANLQQHAGLLVQAYLEQLRHDEPVPLAVEATLETPLVDPFTGEDLGIRLLGITDLVLPSVDGATIIDFKTSGRSGAPLEITHEIQLSVYSHLFRGVTGQDESGLEIHSLVKTKQPKIDVHHYPARTSSHMRRLFAIIHEYLDCLAAGRYNYRPGWTCNMCDFCDKHCSAWCGGD
jgi:RecB family exonuclease